MNYLLGFYGLYYGNSMLFDDNDMCNYDELLFKFKIEKLKLKFGLYFVYCNDGF